MPSRNQPAPQHWLASLAQSGTALKNRWDFFWRSHLRWSRPTPYQEPWEPKEHLFQDRSNAETLQNREQALLHQFSLETFRQQSSRQRYLETLTYLDYLTHLLPEGLQTNHPPAWLDVGAKNWAYVPALYHFLSRHTPHFTLTGIELDGYRLYSDLYTRADYAHTYTAPFPQAKYLVGDVLTHPQTTTPHQWDVISCFLPFVFMEPCLAWGLPDTAFQPQHFFQHLIKLLKPGGWLLLINQGSDEAAEQLHLLQQHPPTALHIEPLGPLPPSFLPYQYPRYAIRCQTYPKG